MIDYKIKNGFHILLPENDEYLSFGYLLCEQCGDQIDTDTYYCPNCREFVGGCTICDYCGGDGYVDVLDESKANSQTISPPYKRIDCPECGGEGRI